MAAHLNQEVMPFARTMKVTDASRLRVDMSTPELSTTEYVQVVLTSAVVSNTWAREPPPRLSLRALEKARRPKTAWF
jgi:hypothetical protein